MVEASWGQTYGVLVFVGELGVKLEDLDQPCAWVEVEHYDLVVDCRKQELVLRPFLLLATKQGSFLIGFNVLVVDICGKLKLLFGLGCPCLNLLEETHGAFAYGRPLRRRLRFLSRLSCGIELEGLAPVLLLLVEIEEEGRALALRVRDHYDVGHGLVVDLHEGVRDLKYNVLHKLGLFLVQLDLIQVDTDVGGDEKVEIVPEEERECEHTLGLLEGELDFLGHFFLEKEQN